jgi:hypothetical protein
MTTISDFGTLELKRMRVDEEITATRYGTEIMDRDLIFKVGDVSNPNQSIRFAVHDGSVYREAFSVDKNGFAVDDLQMSGPTSTVAAVDALVKLGELKLQHFTDHANVRSGEMIFSLNIGDTDAVLTPIMTLTPEHVEMHTAATIHGAVSCAGLTSDVLVSRGDVLSTRVASFAHPHSSDTVTIALNADGALELKGNVNSAMNTTRTLSCHDVHAVYAELSTCSVSSLALGTWSATVDRSGMRLSGAGNLYLDSCECETLEALALNTSSLSVATLSADGANIATTHIGSGGVSTSSLATSAVEALQELTLSSDGLRIANPRTTNEVLLTVLSSGVELRIDEHESPVLHVGDGVLDAGGLRCLRGEISVQRAQCAELHVDKSMTVGAAVSCTAVYGSTFSTEDLTTRALSASTITTRDHYTESSYSNTLLVGDGMLRVTEEGVIGSDGVFNTLSASSVASYNAKCSHLSAGSCFVSLIHATGSVDVSCSSINVSNILNVPTLSCSDMRTDSAHVAGGAFVVNAEGTVRVSNTLQSSVLSVGRGHVDEFQVGSTRLYTEEPFVGSDSPLVVDGILRAGAVEAPSVSVGSIQVHGGTTLSGTSSGLVIGTSTTSNLTVSTSEDEPTLRVHSCDTVAFAMDTDDASATLTVTSAAVTLQATTLIELRRGNTTMLAAHAGGVTLHGDLSVGSITLSNLQPLNDAVTCPVISVARLEAERVHAETALHTNVVSCSEVNTVSIHTQSVRSTTDILTLSTDDVTMVLDSTHRAVGINCTPNADLHVFSNERTVALCLEGAHGATDLVSTERAFALTTPAAELTISTSNADLRLDTNGLHVPDLTTHTIHATALSVGTVISSLSCPSLVTQNIDTDRIEVRDLVGGVFAIGAFQDGATGLSCSSLSIGGTIGVTGSITCTDAVQIGVSEDDTATPGSASLFVQSHPLEPTIVAHGHASSSTIRIESPAGLQRVVEYAVYTANHNSDMWTTGVRNLPQDEDDSFGIYSTRRDRADLLFDHARGATFAVPLSGMHSLSLAGGLFLTGAPGDATLEFDTDSLRLSCSTPIDVTTPNIVLCNRLSLSGTGGALSCPLDMRSHSIINVASPVNASDAVNKAFFDNTLSALFSTAKVFTAPVFFAPPSDLALRAFSIGLAAGGTSASNFQVVVGETTAHSFTFADKSGNVLMRLSPSLIVETIVPMQLSSTLRIGATHTFDATGDAMQIQGGNVHVVDRLGVGRTPQYRLHVAAGTEDDIAVFESSNVRARATVSTSDTTGQAMTSYTTPDYTFSTGYYGAFDAFVIASSNDLLQNTHLLIYRDTKQSVFAGDVTLSKTGGSYSIEESGVTTMRLDKSNLQAENFGLAFVDAGVSHTLGGKTILRVLSVGATVDGMLSASSIGLGSALLSTNDVDQVVCDKPLLSPAVFTADLSVDASLGFNLYRDGAGVVRHTSFGDALMLDFDQSTDKLDMSFSTTQGATGAAFVSMLPTLSLRRQSVCINTDTPTPSAGLTIARDTGAQLSLVQSSNASFSTELLCDDIGTFKAATTNRRFEFDGSIQSESIVLDKGDVTWRFAIQDDGSLAVQKLENGTFVTKTEFV